MGTMDRGGRGVIRPGAVKGGGGKGLQSLPILAHRNGLTRFLSGRVPPGRREKGRVCGCMSLPLQ